MSISPRLPLLLILGAVLAGAAPASADLDGAAIESLAGAKGTWNPAHDVFKVGFPRTEVKVRVDGAALVPFRGLGTWAAFTQLPAGRAMVMGDNVLFEDEVNPVIDAALANGLDVTALHNHFFYDQPRVYFMHVGGAGSATVLAAAIGQVYRAVHELRKAHPHPATVFGAPAADDKSAVSAAPLEAAFGLKADVKDGMAKFVWGRETTMDGATMGAAMGVNTWAVFAGSDAQAVVDGDFAMHEDEVPATLKALRAGGVNIVAIHHHMLGEQPRIIFLHFWAKGPAAAIATTLKSALAVQAAGTPATGGMKM